MADSCEDLENLLKQIAEESEAHQTRVRDLINGFHGGPGKGSHRDGSDYGFHGGPGRM